MGIDIYLIIFKYIDVFTSILNKKTVMLLFLFTSYVSAHIGEDIKENKSSMSKYSQNNSDTAVPNACVSPPCNDE
ncbi:hypothetical protein QSH14_17455 [Proteus faecis]|uniref:Uncharacterized protein n=1 Tax=Proteus faecis TaxID=2050967 RepID=A0AAW7CQH1_9GAMM|nr:hypothetical protein [Proteus faecis]MBG3014581.1 hypothetical protein [Proteus mirabilis]MDL5168865.1 hypothetical protein [Proteus faecis]MDL5276849.1 hypothetical protein [Proteus faecis]MDL5280412.1 hypothetical protein [Proteus faecis]MDL5309419.1 hypothetical protein [Proteus faecis]